MKIINGIRNRDLAVDPANLLFQPLNPQHIADGRAGLDDSETNLALREFRVQGKQHAGAGDIEMG